MTFSPLLLLPTPSIGASPTDKLLANWTILLRVPLLFLAYALPLSPSTYSALAITWKKERKKRQI